MKTSEKIFTLPFKESLVIIPTFNEKQNVAKMVEAIFDLYPLINLLIVDDRSPDGTANEVKEYQKHFSRNLFLLEREKKTGIGGAYIAGFKWALERDFNYIFEMDCDFSHDPKDIQRLLKHALENDLVIGSRYIGGIRIINWPFRRLLLSYLASIYIRLVTGLPIHDTTGGFKCFARKALLALNLDDIMSQGHIFQLELNYKLWMKGMKIKEVPIIFQERQKGESKMKEGIIFEAFFKVLMLVIRNFIERIKKKISFQK